MLAQPLHVYSLSTFSTTAASISRYENKCSAPAYLHIIKISITQNIFKAEENFRQNNSLVVKTIRIYIKWNSVIIVKCRSAYKHIVQSLSLKAFRSTPRRF